MSIYRCLERYDPTSPVKFYGKGLATSPERPVQPVDGLQRHEQRVGRLVHVLSMIGEIPRDDHCIQTPSRMLERTWFRRRCIVIMPRMKVGDVKNDQMVGILPTVFIIHVDTLLRM